MIFRLIGFVVSLFHRQIKEGLKITLTHSVISSYLLITSEATQLAIQ
ncbi:MULTISPECIES: polysaccharide biosynthesis protein [unclassified Pseudoalteromonas]